MLVGGPVVAAGALAAHHGHVFAFDANLFRLVNQLPDALGRPLLAVMQLAAVAAVPAVVAVVLAARRPRLARDLALSGSLAWVLGQSGQGPGRAGAARCPDRWGHRTRGQHRSRLPLRPSPWRPRWRPRPGRGRLRPARRAVWGVVWLVALGRMYAGAHLPLDVVGGAALGWAVAAATHLAVGAPGGLPTASAILEGLRPAGIDPVTVDLLGADARGSVPFVVRARDGERWFVKAVGREQRDADLLYKLWRWAVFREVEDESPFATPKQAVEHEAYIGLLAARAGVRTRRC